MCYRFSFVRLAELTRVHFHRSWHEAEVCYILFYLAKVVAFISGPVPNETVSDMTTLIEAVLPSKVKMMTFNLGGWTQLEEEIEGKVSHGQLGPTSYLILLEVGTIIE